MTGQIGGAKPEIHSWPDEFDYSPIPDNPCSEQLHAHITEILDNHYALEERHSEALVRLCRATALKNQAHGHYDEAQEWCNYANKLSEAAAVRSEVADKLRAHFENTNGHGGFKLIATQVGSAERLNKGMWRRSLWVGVSTQFERRS